jgi:WD40 repeat protein
MDLSKDNQYIVTLGADTDQTMSLWDWTNDKEEGPICSVQFLRSETYQNQYWIKFNPDKNNEIVSNGKWRVLFHSWTTQSKKFETYSPPVELRDMPSGSDYGVPYTKTVFIPGGTEMAVTGTEMGKILVWDQSVMVSGIGDHNQKRLIKIVSFTNSSINVLMTVDDKYLVCGDKGGTIRFYDFKFWLVAWFENLNLAEIKSLSFSKKPAIAASQNLQADRSSKEELQAAFRCSEFLVADSSACVMQLRPTLFEAINDTDKQKDMEVIMNGIRSHVSAVACHPHKSIVAFAIGEGYLQLWDYVNKKDYHNDFQKADLSAKVQDKGGAEEKGKKSTEKKRHQFYTTLKFTQNGEELLIGRSDGAISVFNPDTREFKKLSGDLKVSDSDQRKGTDAILQIVTSNCGRYFATSDTNHCVSLFKKDHLYGDKANNVEWQFNGKQQSH